MTTSLFVGNIPYGALEAEILELFAQFGEVRSVRFMMDFEQGRFRGFGFVTMPCSDAERARLALHEHDFQGRRLCVSVAKGRNNNVTFEQRSERAS